MIREITREQFIDCIAHMITSGQIPNDLFEYYFKNTKVGRMVYQEIIDFLECGGKEKPRELKITNGGDELCANCLNPIFFQGEPLSRHYCDLCGQKIDWGERY